MRDWVGRRWNDQRVWAIVQTVILVRGIQFIPNEPQWAAVNILVFVLLIPAVWGSQP